MMAGLRFRMYIENQPATQQILDQVDQITVEQSMGATWEARLVISLATDEKGSWAGVDSSFSTDFGRVRVELDPGDGSFVPLIDGPLVGADQDMSAEPGESIHTAIVADDGVYLDRQQRASRFQAGRRDDELARELFDGAPQIASQDIESAPGTTPETFSSYEFQRGTGLGLLQRLAERQGMYAAVLPGRNPGESIGAFKQLPTVTDGLPALVLLGDDRNVSSFTMRRDSLGPARVDAYSLNVSDKTVSHGTASFGDADLFGGSPTLDSADDAAGVLLGPDGGASVDAQTRATAAANRYAFAHEAAGTTLNDAYAAVLTPYRLVSVKGVEKSVCGTYLVKAVRHQITRSGYVQSFVLGRNAKTGSGGAGFSLPGVF
jgi:hypothetical protein